MKLTAIGLVIAGLVFGISPASANGGRFDGAPIQFRPIQLHVHGQAVSAQQLIAETHIMNQWGLQPVGLWVYFYVQPNAATGNASHCERWFNQVKLDENHQTSASPTRSWLEIQVSEEIESIQTDEGYSLIPDAGISCWEALEFRER
jgi:hypothetical protein